MRYNRGMKKASAMRVTKGIIFFAPIAIAVFLFAQFTALRGELTLEYDFASEDDFVSQWYPTHRASDRLENLRNGRNYQVITGDPTYIDVTVPRAFDSVDMTVEYRNPDHAVIDAGIVSNKAPWLVEFFPFENKIIDAALDEWPEPVVGGGVTLLQSPDVRQFPSVEAFTENLPVKKRIGTYFHDIAVEYSDPTYTKQPGTLHVPAVLRGQHEFVTYIKNEPLKASFEFIDMNLSEGEDPIKVEVYGGGVLIHEELLTDDGVIDESARASEKQTLTVDLPNLPEGTYRYVLPVSQDIAITSVSTEQHQFVAKDRVHAIDNVWYKDLIAKASTGKTTLFTDAPFLDMITEHPEALQTVHVDEQAVELAAVDTRVHWIASDSSKKSLHSVRAPKSDVDLRGHGYIAFTKESFFDPDYRVETMTSESRMGDYDYILYKGYTPPQVTRETITQTFSTDITRFPIDRKNLTFAFVAQYVGEQGHAVEVQNVRFDFHREPLTTRLWKRIKGEL